MQPALCPGCNSGTFSACCDHVDTLRFVCKLHTHKTHTHTHTHTRPTQRDTHAQAILASLLLALNIAASLRSEANAVGKPGTIALKGAQGAAVYNVDTTAQMHIGVCDAQGGSVRPVVLSCRQEGASVGKSLSPTNNSRPRLTDHPPSGPGRVVSFDRGGVAAEEQGWDRALSVPTGVPLSQLQDAIAAYSERYRATRRVAQGKHGGGDGGALAPWLTRASCPLTTATTRMTSTALTLSLTFSMLSPLTAAAAGPR